MTKQLPLCSPVIGHPENRVREPTAKVIVVLELFEELCVVLKHGCDHALEGLVVLDAGVLSVGVLPGVLVGVVC